MHFNIHPMDQTTIMDSKQHRRHFVLRVYTPFHQSQLHLSLKLLHFGSSWRELRSVDNAAEDYLSAVLLPGHYVLRIIFDLQFTEWHTEMVGLAAVVGHSGRCCYSCWVVVRRDGRLLSWLLLWLQANLWRQTQSETVESLACMGFTMELAIEPQPVVRSEHGLR